MSVQILIVDGDSVRPMSAEEFGRRYYDPKTDARLKTVKKDATVPKVGDIVRFNDYGLRQVFGSPVGKSFMKKLELRVTHVDDVSMTYPEPTFAIEVNDPEINQFMIDNACFDIVRRA